MRPSSSIKSSTSLPISSPVADPADVAAAETQVSRSRRREDIADRYKWNLTDIFESWNAWEAGYKQPRSRHRALRGAQGHARRRTRPAARRVPAVGRPRTTGVSRLVFPVAALRRGSAGQRRQCEAAAGPDSLRPVEAGRVVVQPRAAQDSPGDRPRLDGRLRAAAVVSLCDRGSRIASRNTCSTRPASG